jgi:PAS domain S-box-containing protein
MNTDTLLDAISRSSAALFGGRGMERAVARLVRGLGEAAGAGRAYFVENRPGPRGGPAAATVCEWVAPGAAARFGASGLRGLPPPRMGSLPERMRRGPFHGLVGAMPRPIRGALRARRALSVAIAPVRAGAEWHGFLGLEDCSAPRRWSKTEMAALRVAAGVLGAAIGSRRAGERLRSVLEGGMDSLDTGLIILDRSFRVVWMNRTMERFLGIGRSRLVGGDQRGFVRGALRAIVKGHAGFARGVLDGYRGAGRGGPLRCEVAAARGRAPRVLLYRSTPIRRGALAGGRVEHFTDITALERANKALRFSEGKYRDIVERMSEGVCHSDERRVIRYANRRFRRIFGYSARELIGRREEDLLDAEGMKAYRREQRRRRRGEAVRYELRIRARGGEMVPVMISAVPVIGEGGRFRGTYAVITDMREWKRIESLKDDLLRDASHELKAPVAKIRMGLDLVKKRRPAPLDDEERLGIAMIESGAAHIQKNVDALTDLSALDSGRISLSRERLGLEAILAPLAAEFGPEALKKGVTVAPPSVPRGLRVTGDRERVRQLFRCLLENAVRFSSSGVVRVRARRTAGGVVVSVADEGRGIEPAYIGRIFDRHFQRYPSEAGTGLGLPICRRIVELHGGRIWAESGGSGKGMTLRVAFPSRAGRPVKRGPATARRDARAERTNPGRPGRGGNGSGD